MDGKGGRCLVKYDMLVINKNENDQSTEFFWLFPLLISLFGFWGVDLALIYTQACMNAFVSAEHAPVL